MDQLIETTGTDQTAESYKNTQYDKNIVLCPYRSPPLEIFETNRF